MSFSGKPPVKVEEAIVQDNVKEAEPSNSPDHIAIIMDGNGRWAQQQEKPRAFGHKAGVDALKKTIEYCAKHHVKFLTVFAFSSENWLRPAKEVDILMSLFMLALKQQSSKLHKNNIRLKVIGDCARFNPKLQAKIKDAEHLTADNTGLTLVVAANYGGQWDIQQATQQLIEQAVKLKLPASELDLADFLSTRGIPDPDLFIRTGGEQRISNFLLWQLAYTELYFTETLWPSFGEAEMDEALKAYSSRQRRFGKVSEQITGENP